MYTAIYFTNEQRASLTGLAKSPEDVRGWEHDGDHVTLYYKDAEGNMPLVDGARTLVELDAIGSIEGRVVAYRVSRIILLGKESKQFTVDNRQLHLTMYINKLVGAKRSEANQIVDWQDMPRYNLEGMVIVKE